MAVSNTTTVTISSPLVPSWYSALAHKQWVAPVSNWIGATGVKSTHTPTIGSHFGVYDGYNGMGCDTQRKWIFTLANGGHNNYDGNEVYAFDLSAASPAWTRLRNATQVSGLNQGQDYTVWPSDSRPTANHTMTMTVAAEGRWFLPGLASRNYQGTADYYRWFEFDVNNTGTSISGANYDWINLGSNHKGGTWEVVSGTACFDPVDRHIITLQIANFTDKGLHFTPITAVTGLPQYSNTTGPNDTGYANIAIDTTNRVVIARSGGFYSGQGQTYHIYRIGTPALKTTAPTVMTQGSGVTGTAAHFQSQLHWHPPSNAFITVSNVSGQSMYKLTPTVSGGNYTSMAWSQVSTGWTGASPVYQTAGGEVAGKFQLMPMADGSYAAIWWSRYAFPDVYVCRLTGAI